MVINTPSLALAEANRRRDPAENGEAMTQALGREEIARIIDPDVWGAHGYHRDIVEADRARSLSKADQIITAWNLRAPVGEGWRPMESAPKDGTPILAGSVNHGTREVVCWQDGAESGSLDNILADTPLPEEGWVNQGPNERFYANPRWFTHWRPLPEPPEQSSSRADVAASVASDLTDQERIAQLESAILYATYLDGRGVHVAKYEWCDLSAEHPILRDVHDKAARS